MLTPTIHEQEDGTFLALCATQNSSKESLVSWTSLLVKANPTLSAIPIVYRLRHRTAEMIVDDQLQKDNVDPSPVRYRVDPASRK